MAWSPAWGGPHPASMGLMVVNLTPHEINLPGRVVSPSGEVARVSVVYKSGGFIKYTGSNSRDPIEAVEATYGKVEGLPDARDGVIYIVSGMVASAAPRGDVFSPGELERDEEGRVVGCLNLKASLNLFS